MSSSKIYLFKRPNGIWYILYTVDGRKKWKSTGCTDRGSALKKLSEFEKPAKPKPTSSTFSSFVSEFLAFAKSTYAKSSVTIFTLCLRHLQAMAGDCHLSAITPRHVDLYKSNRLRQVSATSVNVELRSLRTIFNIAIRWDLIETNPFKSVKLLRIPESAPTFFSRADFAKLMDAIGSHWIREVILFGVSTGLRRGEIMNLKWEDVNLEGRTAEIRSSVSYTVKAGKRRIIPLSDAAISVLQQRKVRSRTALVFDKNGVQVGVGYVTHKLKYFIRLAGLNPALHFHSLRHTFGTWLAQDRVSIYEIQKLLGHSDISMTQIYSHLVTSELHDAVNRIRVGLPG